MGALLGLPRADALEQPKEEEKRKTKVVVLGTGWAAIAFLKALRPFHSRAPDIVLDMTLCTSSSCASTL